MKTGQVTGKKWYSTRGGSALSAVIALVLAYAIGSRAIYTGSLQQYGLTFILLVVIGNRLLAACMPHAKPHRKTA
jgi:hypothetical protein